MCESTGAGLTTKLAPYVGGVLSVKVRGARQVSRIPETHADLPFRMASAAEYSIVQRRSSFVDVETHYGLRCLTLSHGGRRRTERSRWWLAIKYGRWRNVDENCPFTPDLVCMKASICACQ